MEVSLVFRTKLLFGPDRINGCDCVGPARVVRCVGGIGQVLEKSDICICFENGGHLIVKLYLHIIIDYFIFLYI